jgi:hypothetical protein
MVQITVTLARTLTNWQFTATPIETFLSDAGAFVNSDPYSVTVASGNSGVLDIPASTNQKVSYRFEVFQNVTIDRFFLQDGTEYQGARWQWTSGGSFDNNWYTGQAPKDPSQKLLTRLTGTEKRFVLDPINALCPLVNTNLKDLFSTSVTSYQLDAGARRVAELMLGDVALKAQLPKGINPRGAFLSTNTYNQNDGVTYNGEFWVYESTTAGSSTPGTGTAWRRYIEKGDPGGTGAQSVGFNAATWNAQTAAFKLESTSRGDSLELFNAVIPPDLSGFAQRGGANTFSDSNTFNGAVTFNSTCAVPLRAPGTNNANAASTAFVQAAIAALGGLKDVAVIQERQPQNGDAGSSISGLNTRGLEFVSGNNTSFVSIAKPTITLTAGSYLFFATAPAVASTRHRLSLHRINNTAARILNGKSHFNPVQSNQLTDHGNDQAILYGFYSTTNNNDQLQLRHYCQNATGTFGLGKACNEAAQQEVYAELVILKLT